MVINSTSKLVTCKLRRYHFALTLVVGVRQVGLTKGELQQIFED